MALGIGVTGQILASPCRVCADKTLQGFGAGPAAIPEDDLVEKKFSFAAAVKFLGFGLDPRPQAAVPISSRLRRPAAIRVLPEAPGVIHKLIGAKCQRANLPQKFPGES
jgi:hypothetical protein